jgi:hypothetical protein
VVVFIVKFPELCAHVVQALQASTQDEVLDASTCSIVAAGVDMDYVEFSNEKINELVLFIIYFILLSFILA